MGEPNAVRQLCDTEAVASDDERPPSTEPFVLGAEIAAASAIEQIRLQEHPGDSPLADMAYERGAAFVESPRFRPEGLDGELRSVLGQWAQLSPEDLEHSAPC